MTKLLSIIVVMGTILSISCVKGVDHYNYKMVNGNGYYTKPLRFPVTISTTNPELENSIRRSIDWWNEELKEYWNDYCKVHLLADCDRFPKFMKHVEDNGLVQVHEVPDENQTYNGLATTWTTVGGTITSADVDLVQTRWDIRTSHHELGHAVFGLAHDTSKYEEEEWGSIMLPYFENDLEYFLMYHDAELIFRDFILLKTNWR